MRRMRVGASLPTRALPTGRPTLPCASSGVTVCGTKPNAPGWAHYLVDCNALRRVRRSSIPLDAHSTPPNESPIPSRKCIVRRRYRNSSRVCYMENGRRTNQRLVILSLPLSLSAPFTLFLFLSLCMYMYTYPWIYRYRYRFRYACI